MDLQTKIKTRINSTFKSSGGDFTNLMHLSKSVIIIETEECLPPPPLQASPPSPAIKTLNLIGYHTVLWD